MLTEFVETFYADFKRFLEGDNDCLDTLTRNIDLLCVLIDQEEVQLTANMTIKLCHLLLHQPQPQPLPLRHLADHLSFLLGGAELNVRDTTLIMKVIRDYLDLLNPFRELPFLHPAFSVKTFNRFFELARLYEDRDQAREWLAFCLPIWNQIKWFEWPTEGVYLDDDSEDPEPDSLEDCISRYGTLHKRTWAMKERLATNVETLQSIYYEKIECLGADHSSVNDTKKLLLNWYEAGTVEAEILKRTTVLSGTDLETWTNQYQQSHEFAIAGQDSKNVCLLQDCYNAMTEKKVPFDHPLLVSVSGTLSSTLMMFDKYSEAEVIDANIRREQIDIPNTFHLPYQTTPWDIQVEEIPNKMDMLSEFRYKFPGLYDRLFFIMQDEELWNCTEKEGRVICHQADVVKVNNRYLPVLQFGITGETSEKFKKMHLFAERVVIHVEFVEHCSFMEC